MDIVSFFANPGVRDIGAVAILTGVVIMVFTGRLVPISTHRRELAAADKRTEDAIRRGNEWKQAAEETTKVNAVIREQNSDLIEANKIVGQLIRAAGPSLGDTQPGVP